MNLDVIRAVESCYACAARDEDWLGGVLDALSDLDQGHLGMLGEVFRFSPDGKLAFGTRVARPAVPPGFLEERDRTFPQAMLAVREPVVLASKRGAQCGMGREATRFHERYGAADGIGIFAADPDGSTLLVSAAVMAAHPLAPRTLHQLSLFSAHLSAAARLRQATALQGGGDVSEAVLDPVGKVLHAAGPARAPEARRTLADAVRRMDRARGALRRTEPDEALQLWQGLVDGAWSLVEQCEADGKRYVLAHRNAPGVRDPKALTPHERFVVAFAAMGHQNKFIGYELGLSASGVAEHLSSAARKLRVSSRAELVRLLAPLIREQRRTEQSP
ncbi:MAG TPA: helix-turn-helix transcriptional regulator [Anaeromyxobacter sp.]